LRMLLKCCAPAQGVDVEKGVEVYVEGAGSKAGAEVTGVLLFDMKDVRWMVRLPDGATLALPQFLQLAGHPEAARDQLRARDSREPVSWHSLDGRASRARKRYAERTGMPLSQLQRKMKRKADEAGHSDTDEEGVWDKAQKLCEVMERLERADIYKTRRKAEQQRLNETFFERRKHKEPDFGLDCNVPLFLADALAAAGDNDCGPSAADRAMALHALLEQDEEGAAETPQLCADVEAEVKRLNQVSGEFHAMGRIQVNSFRRVAGEARARAGYDVQRSREWFATFSKALVQQPRDEPAAAPAPAGGVARPRHSGAAQQRGCAARRAPQQRASEQAGEEGLGEESEEGWAAEEPSALLTDEEAALFHALFACYGNDAMTIARLLCRRRSVAEVQSHVARAGAEIRCEVCRNPEEEDRMMPLPPLPPVAPTRVPTVHSPPPTLAG